MNPVGQASILDAPARSVRPYSAQVQDHISPYRYGIFLRPGPRLGADALRAMEIAHRQFGFQAAISYAPHTTLVGSVALETSESLLLDALNKTLSGRPAVPIWNRGLGRQFQSSIGYNVNEDGSGGPNMALRGLVHDLLIAMEPLRTHPVTDRGIVARRRERAETFQGHLTVVGHDGIDHPELVEECLDYLKALRLDGPETDPGDVVSLFRFHSDDWSGRYWERPCAGRSSRAGICVNGARGSFRGLAQSGARMVAAGDQTFAGWQGRIGEPLG